MVNILVPINKKSSFFGEDKYPFPQYMIEINRTPILKMVIDNYKDIDKDIKFIFILSKEDCTKYFVENITKLLTDDNCINIIADSFTKGSTCTCLLAIEEINNSDELFIINSDQIFKEDLSLYLNQFRKDNVDAAVLYFESIHPRWSFIKLDEDNNIMELNEKKPTSKNAVAGLYYFKKGSFFIKGAMENIKKDDNVNGKYYISHTLNELILKNMKVKGYSIKNDNYITLYSPDMIDEYKNGGKK